MVAQKQRGKFSDDAWQFTRQTQASLLHAATSAELRTDIRSSEPSDSGSFDELKSATACDYKDFDTEYDLSKFKASESSSLLEVYRRILVKEPQESSSGEGNSSSSTSGGTTPQGPEKRIDGDKAVTLDEYIKAHKKDGDTDDQLTAEWKNLKQEDSGGTAVEDEAAKLKKEQEEKAAGEAKDKKKKELEETTKHVQDLTALKEKLDNTITECEAHMAKLKALAEEQRAQVKGMADALEEKKKLIDDVLNLRDTEEKRQKPLGEKPPKKSA